MRRSLYSVVAGALLIGAVGHAGAQDAGAPVKAGESADFATVIGIAKGDLLNIRAAASATGMTIARVPNGTLVKTFGCNTVNGNLWCKVEDAGDSRAIGWTPARYLSGYEDKAIEAAAAAAAPGPADDPTIMSSDRTFDADIAKRETDARARGVVASFYTEPLSQAALAVPDDRDAEPAGDAQRSTVVAKAEDGGTGTVEAKGVPPVGTEPGGEPKLTVAPFVALPVVPAEGHELASAPADAAPAEEAADVALPQEALVPQPSPVAGGAQPARSSEVDAPETPAAAAEAAPAPVAAAEAQAEPETTGTAEAPREFVPVEPKKVTVTRILRAPDEAGQNADAVVARVGDEQSQTQVPAPATQPEQISAVSAQPPVPDPVAPPKAVEEKSAVSPAEAADDREPAGEAEEPVGISRFQELAGSLRRLFGTDEEPVAADAVSDGADPAAETPVDVAGVAPPVAPGDVATSASIPDADASAVPDIVAAPAEATVALAGGDGRIEGEVPCARYLGQPMRMCRAGVVRESAQEATVTVAWPDGGQRIIRFRGGRVEGSDSAQPFKAVREADLNMIRIGRTERFEIPDTLAFGN